MEILPIILAVGLVLTIIAFAWVLWLFLRQKSEKKTQIDNLLTQLKNSNADIQALKDLLLTKFATSQASSKERFDYLDKSFHELSKIFLSSKRGMLGNSYLNELLAISLPQDKIVYQLEYTLKKKTNKQEGLRVDAIIFGPGNKNNLAIDSKFPLDNYLLMIDETKSSEEQERASKDFIIDCKRHVEKTSLYISEEDSIYQAVMFLPSDAIYLKINELKFYGIVEFALKKKVWICSPTTLYIVLNQILLANRNWELYKNSEKILVAYLEISQEFTRFDSRWQELSKNLINSIKKALEMETTISKIIKKTKDLQKFQIREEDQGQGN